MGIRGPNHDWPRKWGGLLFAAGTLFLVSCAETRVNQFDQFAQAGTAYTDAITKLTDAAGKAAVQADSNILVAVRGTDSKENRANVTSANKQMQERLRLLSALDQQTRLLDTYFVALANLAGSTAPAQISKSVGGTIDALGSINQSIAKTSVGAEPLQDLATAGTELIVQNVQAGALDRELREHGSTIREALFLQKRAFSLLAEDLEHNLDVAAQNDLTTKVVRPYAEGGDLPKDWADTRATVLEATLNLQAIQAAAGAADKLDKAFQALATGTFTVAEETSLLQEISSLLKVAQKVTEPNTAQK